VRSAGIRPGVPPTRCRPLSKARSRRPSLGVVAEALDALVRLQLDALENQAVRLAMTEAALRRSEADRVALQAALLRVDWLRAN
jgi:hypothetical protein